MNLSSKLSFVAPKCYNGWVIQTSNTIYVVGCLDLLDYNFRILIFVYLFIFFLTLVGIIIKSCPMEFMPFRKINWVSHRICWRALDSIHLVRVFCHLLVLNWRTIEGWTFANEINRKGGPLNVQSMEHIISSIIKLKNLSFTNIFARTKKNLLFGFLFGRLLWDHSTWLSFDFFFFAGIAHPSLFLFKLIFEFVFELFILRDINNVFLFNLFSLFRLLLGQTYLFDLPCRFFVFHDFWVCFDLLQSLSSHLC